MTTISAIPNTDQADNERYVHYPNELQTFTAMTRPFNDAVTRLLSQRPSGLASVDRLTQYIRWLCRLEGDHRGIRVGVRLVDRLAVVGHLHIEVQVD